MIYIIPIKLAQNFFPEHNNDIIIAIADMVQYRSDASYSEITACINTVCTPCNECHLALETSVPECKLVCLYGGTLLCVL